MEVLTVNIVGSYCYKPDIEIVNYKKDNSYTKECIICRRSLFEPSYEMISDNKNILNDVEIVIGKCGHIFHGDCLSSWLKTCDSCPIDKVKWSLHRIADTTTCLALNNNNQYKSKKEYYKKRKNYIK
jgi:hypothetical protein